MLTGSPMTSAHKANLVSVVYIYSGHYYTSIYLIPERSRIQFVRCEKYRYIYIL
jgi:hypothetical protein